MRNAYVCYIINIYTMQYNTIQCYGDCSNSTALADERRVLPVMMAGAVRESSDPSFCCFLPSSSKAQSNAGGSRSGVKPSQKSRTVSSP